MTTSENGPFALDRHLVHLGRDGTAIPQPPFTGDYAWYEGYGQRHGDDGRDGRLLAMHTFDRPWDRWERHAEGAEVVLVTAGAMTLIQEHDGVVVEIELGAGEYAINPPGVWHTADARTSVTAVFVTVGSGTHHRPR